MFKKFLLEKYGYNEPIFINELKIEGMTDNALSQEIKRLTESDFLKRYDHGIYYIPTEGGIFGKTFLDPFLVIKRKYIESKSETFGYISGISFANQLGQTTQMPAIIEIVTNKEATKERIVSVGFQKVRIKKSAIPINAHNAELLQILDAIGQTETFSELSKEETIDRINKYVKAKGFTQKSLSEAIPYINPTVTKKLVEWGTIHEFI